MKGENGKQRSVTENKSLNEKVSYSVKFITNPNMYTHVANKCTSLIHGILLQTGTKKDFLVSAESKINQYFH